MSLQIGIVGLPNVGKSTLFNALTRAGAAVAPYPFTTIDPNVGVVPLDDERLSWLAALVRPERTVPASVEFVDIAGLVRGAHRGEGLGNQFLHHIRTVDAVAMVVRSFTDANVAHVSGTIDPLEDIATVDTELILADLATVAKRMERTRAQARAKPRDFAAELAFLDSLEAHLNAGGKARTLARDSEEQAITDQLFLLTEKPRLYVVNVGEEQLADVPAIVAPVRQVAAAENAPVLAICARLEADLAEWPEADAEQYRGDLGLTASGLQAVVRAAYDRLDLITFFTMVGGREVRAWEIGRGTAAVKAAGKVHSDMERGFIRAEVVAFDDLRAAGSLVAARERGMLRVEGRDYVVQDGDIIQVRFSV
ncbi:MAG: redox-regulated ATPase YchF [Anaerolineae bacterium]